MRTLLSLVLMVVAAMVLWVSRPIWVPTTDNPLMREIRRTTSAGDYYVHDLDLRRLYGSNSIPVSRLIDDLRLAGFSTDWMKEQDDTWLLPCGTYYVPKPDGLVDFAVRREASLFEPRGFMVGIELDGDCNVLKADVGTMMPNTL